MSKKFTIICSSLLLIFGMIGFGTDQRLTSITIDKIVGSHDGPCTTTGPCGIFGGSAGSCYFDSEAGVCVPGDCAADCSGGGSNETCAGTGGTCSIYSGWCSDKIKKTCNMSECSCGLPSYSVGACSRSDC